MGDTSKVLKVGVQVAMSLNCIAIAGAWFFLYQRTTFRQWDHALVPTLTLGNFLLLIILRRIEKHRVQNV